MVILDGYILVCAVLALIYGTAKNSYISDRSVSIRMCKNHFSSCSNKLERFLCTRWI